MENGPETSTGLLRAMAAGADCARWTEFARLYTPLLKKWIAGIRAGHPHVPAYLEDDIVQETLITLMKQFPDSKYDRAKGAFRGYLHGIVRIKVLKACDAYRLTKRGRVDFDTEKAEMEGGKALADGDPVADRLAIERALWEVLVARVFAGGAFSAQSQAIFRMAVSGEADGAEIARKFGVTANNVYQIKKRVLDAVKARHNLVNRSSDDLLDLLERLLKEEETRHE